MSESEIRNKKSLDEVIDLLNSIYYNDQKKAIKDAVYYLKEYRERVNNYLDAEKRHFEAAAILTERIDRMHWHDRFKKQPEKEGQYLTFCHYRNGSTAYKVKLWKDYRFTSENDSVFFWMELPENPEEVSHE